jgi:hypothetical protein
MPRIDSYPNLDNTTVATDDEFVVWDTSGSQVANLPLSALDVRFAPFNTPGMHIYRTGGGYASTPVYGRRDTFVPSEGAISFSPLMAPASTSIDRIGIEVTSAGTASVSVCRLGIWANSGGAPGTLLLDAGTVATDSTGLKEITISQALTLGTLYWLGVVPQDAAATRPTLTASLYNGPVMNVNNPNYVQAGYGTGGAAFPGALASSPALSNFAAGAAPRIFVRFT